MLRKCKTNPFSFSRKCSLYTYFLNRLGACANNIKRASIGTKDAVCEGLEYIIRNKNIIIINLVINNCISRFVIEVESSCSTVGLVVVVQGQEGHHTSHITLYLVKLPLLLLTSILIHNTWKQC